MPKSRPVYPWTALYNLESGLGQQPLPRLRRPGRPRSPVPRKPVEIYLTAEELKNLNRLQLALRERLDMAKVNRGQVVGFALQLLAHEFNKLPRSEGGQAAEGWPQLAQQLFAGE